MRGQEHEELALVGDWEALLHSLEEDEPGWRAPSTASFHVTRPAWSGSRSDASDDSESSDGIPRELAEASTTTTTLVAADPTAKKYPSTYTRQKHEIGLLRQHAKALEEKLQGMAKSTADSALASVRTKRDARRSAAAGSQSWKQLADAQRRRLLLAQSENRALRLSAQNQKRMAKGLERILLKRIANNLMMGERLRNIPRSLEIDVAVSPDDDRAVFAKSIVDIDRMTRSASTALGILQSETPSSGSFSKWEVRLDPVERVYLRLMMTFEVPFKKTDVDAALHYLRTQPMPNSRNYDPQALENYESPVETGVYRARQANQVLFLDDERTLSLAVSYFETADSSRRAVGMVLKSQQWILLSQRTHVSQRTGVTQHSTAIQFYSTISSATAHPGRWRREVAEGIVVPAWENECSASQTEIEGILLQQSLDKTQ